MGNADDGWHGRGFGVERIYYGAVANGRPSIIKETI
jgi:hypothetical protein